ncbi:hypothetical protein JTB14_002293 [Gonioctena quinquepunctata]|nr:hypothetical protein JTB14_002293 [Gonioctena quinquepunctata]
MQNTATSPVMSLFTKYAVTPSIEMPSNADRMIFPQRDSSSSSDAEVESSTSSFVPSSDSDYKEDASPQNIKVEQLQTLISTRKAKTDEELVKTLVFKSCSSDDFVNHITESIISTLSEKYEFRIEKLENDNALLKSEVEALKMINSKVENDYNKSKYELKKKSLILFGLPEVNKEECSELIIDMAVNKIGININRNYIDSCYRIGK